MALTLEELDYAIEKMTDAINHPKEYGLTEQAIPRVKQALKRREDERRLLLKTEDAWDEDEEAPESGDSDGDGPIVQDNDEED